MSKPKLHDCGEAGMLTLHEIAERSGTKWATVRARINNDWTGAEALAGERVGYRATEAHRWRTAKFRARVLQYANDRLKVPASSVDRLPLAYDPWCQAAIDDAEDVGGYSLERTGEILGGLTRERIRQIEDSAFRKIRRAVGAAGRAQVVDLLRGLSYRQQDPFELEESVGYGECQMRRGKP